MNPKISHICLLTSGRIFEVAYGGEEKFTLSLGNWLAKQDCEVTLIGSGFASVKVKHLNKSKLSDEEEFEKPLKNQQKVRVLNPPYSIYLLSRVIMTMLWILRIFIIHQKFPITLIHAQDTGYSGLAAIISGKLLKIPVIISSHGIRHKTLNSVIGGRLRNLLLKFEFKMDVFTAKNANGVIAVNCSIKKYYESLLHKKIDLIPIGIKTKKFQYSQKSRDEIRKELGIRGNENVIGFVGRLSNEKNLFTLFDSFYSVALDDPLLKLVVVGTGPLQAELMKYVHDKSIQSRVIFCGVRYDVGSLLSCFDIFILPSYIEGLSNALLEAMCSGRAIICSNIPANREVVLQNRDALLVDPYETDEFMVAIRCLTNDAELRSKLGKNAKILAVQYDEDLVFSKVLEYYKALSNFDGFCKNG